MLLAIYGDSLGLPRHVIGVRAEETYGELLADRFAQSGRPARLYNRSRAGRPIAEMASHLTDDLWYFGPTPDGVLILQLGIVDCAPRPLSSTWKARVDRMPKPVRSIVKRGVRAARPFLVERNLFVRETEPDAFRAALTEMIRAAAAAFGRVVVVDIAPCHPAILARSPRLPESIDLYNREIDAALAAADRRNVAKACVFDAVSRAGLDGHVIPEDGHHITAAGHRLYAETIEQALARLEAKPAAQPERRA